MAKSHNQKAKILFLEQMLRETGEEHVVTMQEILAKLMEHGIPAERKSIYDDIEALRSFGMDIQFRRGRPGGYYLKGSHVTGKKENQSAMQQEPKNKYEFPKGSVGNKKKQMKLFCTREAEKQVHDFFGEDARYKLKESGSFTVTASQMTDPQFYGWLASMGTSVHIVKPRKLALAYRDYLKTIIKEYKQMEQ